ncbi:MAG TPA: ADP-ribosylglycohydrolase family protein, partial [Roseiflexaceae bacterium]|nr:ADP-ribosylglycohydrolase family protein [Roseiflexaceae bacterium]
DTALRYIPADSLITRLIGDVRDWHARDGDWRRTRERIVAEYGYDRYGGNCHTVPNHALIILGLLYGDDDFQKSLMITNTAGWDTDCNSANVGCLLGIKNGLATIDLGPDWRGPVADRIYLPTADGGRAITDAVRETYEVVNIGRALAGEPPLAPKQGARFHFELPGSVQGFTADQAPDAKGTLTIANVAGWSRRGSRSLALHYHGLAPGRTARATTPTFIPPDAITMPGYALLASPTLYAGQTVSASLAADSANATAVEARLLVHVYGADDALVPLAGPHTTLQPGATHDFTWRIPDTGGAPIAAVVIELHGHGSGSCYLDWLTWEGEADVTLAKPAHGGSMWRRAWVDAADQWDRWWPEPYRIVQNEGRGMISQGTGEWRDYSAETTLTTHMADAGGIGVRYQGLRRYYALLMKADTLQLVKALDGEQILAETPFARVLGQPYRLRLAAVGDRLQAWVDGILMFDIRDSERRFSGGGVALICDDGRVAFDAVRVVAAQP